MQITFRKKVLHKLCFRSISDEILLQSALSTAARSLNVMSTHCEIAISNVINK